MIEPIFSFLLLLNTAPNPNQISPPLSKNLAADYVTLPLYLSNRLKIQQNTSFSQFALLC